jgi:sporulation protein YlmC with PRC-barrel domain
MTTNHSLSRTGADTNTPRPELRLASDVIGMHVMNQRQEKIGEVLDVLVGLGPPHAAFAIIGTGRLFRHGQEYAVPLSALKSMERGRRLLLEMDDMKWQNPQSFNEQAWNLPVTGGSSIRVYSYSKIED